MGRREYVPVNIYAFFWHQLSSCKFFEYRAGLDKVLVFHKETLYISHLNNLNNTNT